MYIQQEGRILKACKYCGSEIFYEKQKLKGTCNYYRHADPKKQQEEVDDLYYNSIIYDHIDHVNTSEFYWCGNCHKRGERIILK